MEAIFFSISGLSSDRNPISASTVPKRGRDWEEVGGGGEGGKEGDRQRHAEAGEQTTGQHVDEQRCTNGNKSLRSGKR